MKAFKLKRGTQVSTVLLIAALGLTLASCNCKKKNTQGSDAAAASGAAAATANNASAEDTAAVAPQGQLVDGNFVADSGEDTTITLPDGTSMTVGSKSAEATLYNRLNGDYTVSDPVKPSDWIRLDRVFFASGGDQLTAESQKQVDNIAKILTAFPNSQLKLGGYTDNTGSPETNVAVSTKRAVSVQDQLIAKGISADRLKSEGFGPEYPVCPANDTPECKAQNRRVDIRITKK